MADTKLVFIPISGVGHLISMTEMAKRFLRYSLNGDAVNDGGLSATLLVPGPISSPAIVSYIKSVAASGFDIEFEELPQIETPTDTDGTEHTISCIISYSKRHVKSAISRIISSPSTRVAALVLDLFAAGLIDVAQELGIPCYIYFTSGAILLALMLHLPELYEKVTVEFEELEGEVTVPGLPPVPPMSMPNTIMKRNRCYTSFKDHGRNFSETNGIIINTFAELESRSLKAIAAGRCALDRRTPPVYPVGPVLMLGETTKGDGPKQRHECLSWLEEQPAESVVLLCFGSKGSFRVPQVKEVASALERSGHRFLWALRVDPNEPDAAESLDKVLPEGFLDRTKGRGLVWQAWVPQAEILAHGAVGGFVTHCGWNSTLESLWYGVPMLGWPLYAEQHLNAFVMAKELEVALGLRVDRKAGNFVSAEELRRGIRCLMEDCEGEGKKVREKAKEMKAASRKALEEGGSSIACMETLVKQFLAIDEGDCKFHKQSRDQ